MLPIPLGFPVWSVPLRRSLLSLFGADVPERAKPYVQGITLYVADSEPDTGKDSKMHHRWVFLDELVARSEDSHSLLQAFSVEDSDRGTSEHATLAGYPVLVLRRLLSPRSEARNYTTE